MGFKVYGCTSMFSSNSTEGNSFRDFLFASLTDVALLNWGLLLKERIFSKRSNCFLL